MSETLQPNLPQIEINEPLDPFAPVAAAALVNGAKAAEDAPRVRIQLEESVEIPPTGQYFGLNGVGYILRPGEPALVPQGLIDILDNAITADPVKDPLTLKVVRWKQRLRFPYRVLGAAGESR